MYLMLQRVFSFSVTMTFCREDHYVFQSWIGYNQFHVALSDKITAFYHSVDVAQQHQSLQRFVYREFGSKGQIKTQKFTTVIFGDVCSLPAAV
jgi:hypothetical protein